MTQRDWLKVGEQVLTDGDGEVVERGDEAPIISRGAFERAVARVKWESAEGPKPMSPALGIQEVIRECQIPRVSRIAISHDLAPYGLYGIEGNYRDGRAQVFVVDRGHDLVPVCVDFEPKGGDGGRG